MKVKITRVVGAAKLSDFLSMHFYMYDIYACVLVNKKFLTKYITLFLYFESGKKYVFYVFVYMKRIGKPNSATGYAVR